MEDDKTKLTKICGADIDLIKPKVWAPPIEDECPKCENTGYEIVNKRARVCKHCSTFSDRKMATLPPRYRSYSFDKFDPKTKNPDNFETDWLENAAMIRKKPFQSYMIYGSFRCCKTYLSVCQMRELAWRGFYRTQFISEVTLIEDLLNQKYNYNYKPKLDLQYIESYKKFHLFIDDVGSSKLTEDKTILLRHLIDIVYSNEFGITITTNLSIEELERHWKNHGGAMVRRIAEICKPIIME